MSIRLRLANIDSIHAQQQRRFLEFGELRVNSDDPRSWLFTRLDAYSMRWPSELAPAEISQFILRQARCFERDCFLDGHVTGSAWILNPSRQKTLLTHHRKLGKWLQLGGHSDGEPNALQVAWHEAEEESGLQVAIGNEQIFDVDIHEIPARGSEPSHKHYDIRFLFIADDKRQLTLSDESNDLRWVALTDLPSMTQEESVLRMMRKTCQLTDER